MVDNGWGCQLLSCNGRYSTYLMNSCLFVVSLIISGVYVGGGEGYSIGGGGECSVVVSLWIEFLGVVIQTLWHVMGV